MAKSYRSLWANHEKKRVLMLDCGAGRRSVRGPVPQHGRGSVGRAGRLHPAAGEAETRDARAPPAGAAGAAAHAAARERTPIHGPPRGARRRPAMGVPGARHAPSAPQHGGLRLALRHVPTLWYRPVPPHEEGHVLRLF